jgi:hypothetical protein
VRSYTRSFSAVQDLNSSLGIIVKNRIQHRDAFHLRGGKHRELFLQPMAIKPLMLETYAWLAVLAERALERAAALSFPTNAALQLSCFQQVR